MSPRAIETEAVPIVCEPVDPRTRKTKVNPFVHKPMDLPVPNWDTEQDQYKIHTTKKLLNQNAIDELKHHLREYLKVMKKNEQHQSSKSSCHSNPPSALDMNRPQQQTENKLQEPQPSTPISLEACQGLEVSYIQTEFGMVYNCVSRPAKRHRVLLDNDYDITSVEDKLSPPTKRLKSSQITPNTTSEVRKIAPPAMPLPEQFKYHNWYLKAYQIWVNWHKSTPPV